MTYYSFGDKAYCHNDKRSCMKDYFEEEDKNHNENDVEIM